MSNVHVYIDMQYLWDLFQFCRDQSYPQSSSCSDKTVPVFYIVLFITRITANTVKPSSAIAMNTFIS